MFKYSFETNTVYHYSKCLLEIICQKNLVIYETKIFEKQFFVFLWEDM